MAKTTDGHTFGFGSPGPVLTNPKAVTSAEEIRALHRRSQKSELMNIVIGGKKTIVSAEELGRLGYGLAHQSSTVPSKKIRTSPMESIA